jgi:hypothetical protein
MECKPGLLTSKDRVRTPLCGCRCSPSVAAVELLLGVDASDAGVDVVVDLGPSGGVGSIWMTLPPSWVSFSIRTRNWAMVAEQFYRGRSATSAAVINRGSTKGIISA